MEKIKCQLMSTCISFLCLVASVQCRGISGGHEGKTGVSKCLNNKVSIIEQNCGKSTDRIYKLPGQYFEIDFEQYGGYITVDAKAGRALYYYFTEASNERYNKKPLVLWLNGGPGCSSLGEGLFEQNGPFKVNKDGKTLYKNQFAWNKDASILYLESPAGTGFSYSNTTSDYNASGDDKTAEDAYIFLLNWLEKYPEYKSRDFYIAGESYAGHFVTQLAQTILRNNACGNHANINLRRVAIGNGYIDTETYEWGRIEYLWSHALISDEMRSELQLHCNFSSTESISDVCNNLLAATLNAVGNITLDEIYAPLCNYDSQSIQDDTSYDPCTDNYVTTYLNRPEVQAALHANVTKIPYAWEICSAKLKDLWKDSATSVLPIIQELMHKGVAVWLYSGDVDSLIPVTATRMAINKLKLPVQTPWYAWYNAGEVGGYVTGYENLTFVTVRGAGHEVASYQPARALSVFTSFMSGVLPPSH
ncbi:serine carboxypeptidase 1-like [Silene latifolia]|uniref:serine carboxypeptidase 1-like n=1 Tax=Silene latifolia TaxID=37657 RepID=UPI003D7851BD